jgi:MHS family proline/betaine transporter-like MFS transporter
LPSKDQHDEGGFLTLLAACACNGLEFYNVTIYVFVSVTLSQIFFPRQSARLGMLITFALFGVSYVVRPLGGLVLGTYADRAGRRSALLLSTTLMFSGAVLLAITPPYRTIGMWAPCSILLARLLQGFALGGDFASVMAYLMERAPPKRRTVYVSLQFASQGFGALLATMVGFALSRLTAAQLTSWGWRMPFLAGLLIAPSGLYLWRNMRDSEEFLHSIPLRHPMRVLFREYGGRIALAMTSVAVLSANIYLRIYLPVFLQVHMQRPIASTFSLLLISAVSTAVLVPFSAIFVRETNALRWMLVVICITLAVTWPLLHHVDRQRSASSVVMAYTVLAVLGALYTAPHAWFVSSLFPVEVRAAGVGAGYNFGVLLFGGFAPAVYEAIIRATGQLAFGAVYFAFAGIVSFIAVLIAMRSVATASERV